MNHPSLFSMPARWIVLALTFFLLAAGGGSAPASIQPGEGISELSLGMPSEELIKILGEPSERTLFDEELKKYTDFGLDVSKEVVFFNSFDFVLVYGRSTTPSYPLFKAFFKDGKLIHIILSSYVHDVKNNILIGKTAAFGEMEAISTELGKYRFRKLEDYDGEYLWLDLGISIIAEKGIARTVEIFSPMSDKEKLRFTSTDLH